MPNILNQPTPTIRPYCLDYQTQIGNIRFRVGQIELSRGD